MESSAQVYAIGGLIALVPAGRLAGWPGDRRRMRRSHPDAVGFMPWTSVFFPALFAAMLLFGLAVRPWLAGD